MFAADVPRDPDFGAAVAATERPTIRSLRGQGHEVHEICAQHLGQRIRHGNLHHLLELPYRFRTVIRQRASATEFDRCMSIMATPVLLRWISGERAQIERWAATNRGDTAEDHDGEYVALFSSDWRRKRAEEDFSQLKFHAVREQHGVVQMVREPLSRFVL